MPEPTTTTTTTGTTEAPAETQATATQSESVDTETELGENGKKAIKAERSRATAAEKERDALKAQLDKIAAANLSDLELAQKQAAEAQAAVTQAQADALRYRIAAKHSITDDDAELFLTGTDEETLTRQAARLVERAPAATAPRADLTQGGSGGTSGSSDPATAFAAFMADQK